MTDTNSPQDEDVQTENGWLQEDADAAEAGLTGSRTRRNKLLIGAAALGILLLAIATVLGFALTGGEDEATPSPSTVTTTESGAAESAAPAKKLAGFDLSGCTADQITIGKDGWVGFSTECIKLISAKDMPDLP